MGLIRAKVVKDSLAWATKPSLQQVHDHCRTQVQDVGLA